MPVNVTVLAGIPPQDSGAASGVVQTTMWLGGSVGLAVLVTVYNAATPGMPALHSVFAVAAGLTTVAMLIAALALRTPRSPQQVPVDRPDEIGEPVELDHVPAGRA
jgi:purine-cytosine permease-like protein